MHRFTRPGLFLAASLLSVYGAAAAETPTRTSIKDLIAQGYQIVDTSSLPIESVQNMTPGTNFPETIVTLQKKNSVAVCIFSTAGWFQLEEASVTHESSCDYRTWK